MLARLILRMVGWSIVAEYGMVAVPCYFCYKRFSKSGKRNRNESCLIVEKVET
jgi:hypothetical protein